MAEHAKRVKIRRKDLRGPDEFETLTGRAVDVATQYRTPLIAALVVLVALGLVVLAVSSWRASRNAAASEEFQRAHDVFAAGRFAEAAKAFAAVADEQAGTPAGRLARLYQGHALARQDDAAGAATAYGEFLATTSDADLLRQDALVNLGRAREATGDVAAARDAYGQAAAIDGPYTEDALLATARLDEAAGRTAEARATYARLLQTATNPDVRAFLATRLPPGTEPAPSAPSADAE
jgi:tetratricopeptide (TPR) repeat protein